MRLRAVVHHYVININVILFTINILFKIKEECRPILLTETNSNSDITHSLPLTQCGVNFVRWGQATVAHTKIAAAANNKLHEHTYMNMYVPYYYCE